MAAKTSINVGITGDAKGFAKELGKAQKETSKFQKKTSKAFGALKLAGIGAASALGSAFIAAGLDFEAMENTLIKGTGATGEALEDLKTQATDVLKTVPETAEVVAGAIADVNTFFGATGDQLEDTTGLFLDFARVTDMDVGDAVARLDAQMTQFNIPLEDTDELLGDLVRISQATGAPMDNLLSQLEKFGPLFSTANFSGEETVAIFGMLETAGVDLAKLGPSLTTFFAEVAEAGGDPRAAFEAMVEQIQNADTETEALALASEAFGTAGARMTSAIRSGNLELDTFGGLLGEGAGLVQAQAESTETLSDKMAIMKNSLMAAMGPIAIELMEKFAAIMESVAPFIEQNKTLFVALGAAVATIGAGFLVFKVATIAMTVATAAQSVATGVWTAAQWALNVALNANPIGLIVAAIALLVAGVILAYQNFDVFREAVDGIADAVVSVVNRFVDLPQDLYDAVINTVAWLYYAGKSVGKKLLKGVEELIESVVETVAGLPQNLYDALVDAVAWLYYAGKSIGEKLLEGIGDALGGAVSWASDLAKTIANALIGFINRLIDDLNDLLHIKVDMPWPSPDININPPDIPNIPLLAEGGIVPHTPGGMLAILGEAGPEAVIPLDRERVGSGAGPMTVNVYLPVGSDGDAVVRALQEYEARNGPVPVGTRSL